MKQKLNQFLIGSDPEYFLQNHKTGKIISAIPYIPGDKDNEVDIGNNCTIQVDNILVEYTVPPTNDYNTMFNNIQYCINYTNNLLTKDSLIVRASSCEPIEDDQLQHPKAILAGCTPDFNVWSKSKNPKPVFGQYRSAGGHVHIGFDRPSDSKENILICESIIKALDLFLGVPSIELDDSPQSKQRKLLYGKSGCFRLQKHGVEYRTLSNYWTVDKNLVKFVFEQCNKAIELVNSTDYDYLDKYSDIIQDAINNSNLNAVKKLTKEFNLNNICVV